MAQRSVLMLGPTGAGKSTLGNYLLEILAFKQAATAAVASETDTIVDSSKMFEDRRLTVVDSPGLGDTNGESIQYLNDIMEAIRGRQFHGILLVVNGAMKHGPELRYALRCLRQCCRPSVDSDISLPQGRVFLIVNKVPSAGFGFGTAPADVDNVVNEQESFLSDMLEMQPGVGLERIFVIKENDPGAPAVAATLRQAIWALPGEPLPVSQFRTFREVTSEADRLQANAISADEHAQQTIDRLKGDIGWHERRIRDLNTAIICTCWVPGAGWAAAAGMAIAIAESERKIPGLQRELRDVESNKREHLELARTRAIAWKEEMAALEQAMSTGGGQSSGVGPPSKKRRCD